VATVKNGVGVKLYGPMHLLGCRLSQGHGEGILVLNASCVMEI